MAKKYYDEKGNEVKKKHPILKWLGIALVALFGLAVIGAMFGDGEPSDVATQTQTEAPAEETAEATNNEETQEKPQENEWVDEKGNLKTPNVIDWNSGTYDIKDIRIGQDKTYSGNSILVIEMDFTNKKDEPSSPWMNFVLDFDMQQSDGTTTKSLNGANGQMPSEDPQAVEMGDAQVNPGKTVHAIIGYEIADENLPIFMQFRVGMDGKGFWINKQ